MPRVRVHQHVNPLARHYREIPVSPIEIGRAFSDQDLPLHIDIGCGRGRFLLRLAESEPSFNYLGLEIREPLVIEANEIARARNFSNLKYEFCNASIDLDVLLEDIPPETISLVSIQFPDPWFKKRHAKRRMVRDTLVESVAANLATNGDVIVQTDVKFLFEEIAGLFLRAGLSGEMLYENPFPIKTEREISVENRSLPVYRIRLTKK